MLDPKEFLETIGGEGDVKDDIKDGYISLNGLLQDYRTHIIQSIIQDLSIQRNVSPEVLEYLRGKV